jgi:hypothetical protein
VIDSQSQRLLQEILRRESRSILLYVGEAYPWTTLQEAGAWQSLSRLIDEERQAIASLGQLMTRRRVSLPVLGVFPVRFTTINFLALDYLLPHLLAAQQRSISDLEADLKGMVDAEAVAEVQQLLDLKRRHLVALEGLAKGQPQATAS